MPIERLLRRPVATLPPDATCAEAAALLRDENIGCVVVADADGRPTGLVTDRDLVVRVMAAGRDPEKLALRQIMSGEPVFLGDERGLGHVVATMRDQGVRRIPVVDAQGRLEGLLALDDLLIVLAEELSGLAETVRREIAPRA